MSFFAMLRSGKSSWLCLLCCHVVQLNTLSAQDNCAVVKLVIEQEVTLARQAFEGRLTLSNELPQSLDDFSIQLNFTDNDNNPVSTISLAEIGDATDQHAYTFFHRLLDASVTLFNEPANGTYTAASIPANSESNITFLIIPAPHAAGSFGTRYFIGATIQYTSGGVEESIVVSPDDIQVLPMPELAMQYFLPYHVYGDNPNTANILEPLVPFSLGVRVINIGAGDANNLKIQSSQPKIVANDSGLAVDFQIIASEVNGQPSGTSLLADFGNLYAGDSSLARWDMTASLDGHFTEFNASISHSDQLGGEITSLIPSENLSTHQLIGDVLFDAEGSDFVEDFLAYNGFSENGDVAAFSPYLYASDFNAPALVDQPNHSYALAGDAVTLTLTNIIPAAEGRVYIKGNNPYPDLTKIIDRVERSDGKLLPAENAWLTHTREKQDPNSIHHQIHLFDTGAKDGHKYRVTFKSPTADNQPPEFQQLPPVFVQVGQALSLAIAARDADADAVVISTGLLPFGAQLTPQTLPDYDGFVRRSFNWTPASNDYIGSYTIPLVASDLKAQSYASLNITVIDPSANRFDAWSAGYGITTPDLLHDTDDDGLVDLMEYALNLNPVKLTSVGLPTVTWVESEGSKYLALSFFERQDDNQLAYELITAHDWQSDYSTWDNAFVRTVSDDQTDVPAGMQRVILRDTVAYHDSDSALQRFAVLKIVYVGVTTAYSPMQGYRKLQVLAQRDNYLSLPMQQAGVLMANVTAVTGTQLSIDRFDLTPDAYDPKGAIGPCFVEILTGQSAGMRIPLVGNNESTLFLDTNENTLSAVAETDRIVVRPYYSIAQLFSDSIEPVLPTAHNAAILSGDALMKWQNAKWTPFPATIFQYIDEAGTLAWSEKSQGYVSQPATLGTGEPFLFRRESAADSTIPVLGALPATPWRVAIQAGETTAPSFTVFGVGLNQNLPLQASSLHVANGNPHDDPVSAKSTVVAAGDHLHVFNSDPVQRGYFGQPDHTLAFVQDTGWVTVGDGEPVGDTVELEPGKAYVIEKQPNSSAAIWVQHQP